MAKKIVYGSVLVCIIVTLACVTACRYASSEKHMAWMMDKFTRDLQLTDEQQATLNAMMEEIKGESTQLVTAYKNTMEAIGSELGNDTFNTDLVEEMFAQTTEPRNAFMSLFITRLAEFHSTLSPEQKEKLMEKIETMKKHRERRCRYMH